MVASKKSSKERNWERNLLVGQLGWKIRLIQMPLRGKKKKAGNPLRKELSNPQGLDFANQAGALMAQPQKIEMLPPKDMTKEATRPEKNHIWSKEPKHENAQNKSQCI